MKRYKENIILIAVIAALSIYVFLHKKDQTNYKLPMIPEITTTEITKLEIDSLNAAVILKKKEGGWYIDPEGYPANQAKVNLMLASLKDVNITALVSNLKNYDLYDLNDEKKIIIRAWSKGKLERMLEIGKTASSYRHTFVKLEQDGPVYHAEGDFNSSFNLPKDKLRDKLVLSFKKIEIKNIDIQKNSARVSLSLNETANTEGEQKSNAESWQTSDGKICSTAKIDTLLDSLSALKCEKYINNKKKDDFKAPIFTIILKGAAEKKLSIFAVQGEDETEYPCTSSENEYPFLLSKYEAEKIMIDPEGIVEE